MDTDAIQRDDDDDDIDESTRLLTIGERDDGDNDCLLL